MELQKSPQRVGLLREKLLRLAPSCNQQNTIIAYKEEVTGSQSAIPTLNVEPATESGDEGEDVPDAEERHENRSKGDNKANSEVEAHSHEDVEEEVALPDITVGSCTPRRESQNSKYGWHCLRACDF